MREHRFKLLKPGKKLALWRAQQEALGNKIVFTNGCFDILHFGHIQYLEKARKLGNVLVVAVNSDDSVKRLKGPSRPIHSEQDRARVLAALESVDAVIVFDDDTPLDLIHSLRPHICVKGSDWKGKGIPEESAMKKQNGRMRYISLAPGRSTSVSIQKILSTSDQPAVRGQKKRQK